MPSGPMWGETKLRNKPRYGRGDAHPFLPVKKQRSSQERTLTDAESPISFQIEYE